MPMGAALRVAVCGPDKLGQQVAGTGRRLVGELPLLDDLRALRAGIEGAAAEAPHRLEGQQVGVVLGHALQVSGRIQERDDAARHVQRAGARAVEPPPRTCLQELRNEYRLGRGR
jgi:hypothetical protein